MGRKNLTVGAATGVAEVVNQWGRRAGPVWRRDMPWWGWVLVFAGAAMLFSGFGDDGNGGGPPPGDYD